MTDDKNHGQQPTRRGRFRRSGGFPDVEAPGPEAATSEAHAAGAYGGSPGSESDMTDGLRADPDERLADAMTSPPPPPVVVRRTSWLATLFALLALVIAIGAAMLPRVQPMLMAEFGHIPAVAVVLGAGSEAESQPEEIAALRHQVTALASRLAAEEENSGETFAHLARIDASISAIEARAATRPSADMPLLPDAAPGDAREWSAMVGRRIDAVAEIATDAASRLESAEMRLADTARRLDALDEVDNDIRAVAERLVGVEDVAVQTQDGLTATRAEMAQSADAIVAIAADLEQLADAVASTRQ